MCLQDRRIVGYFKRKLVNRKNIAEALVNGVAFDQALTRTSYQTYAHTRLGLQYSIERNSVIIASGAFNRKTLLAILSTLFFIAFLLMIADDTIIVLATTTLASVIVAGVSALFFSTHQVQPKRKIQRHFFFIVGVAISMLAIIAPHLFMNLQWTPFILIPAWILAFVSFYAIGSKGIARYCLSILVFCWESSTRFLREHEVSQDQEKWLDDCTEDVIIPQAVLAINTVLGADKDQLLVEQNSEGLRKLQDPSFTVSTRSEQRISNVLSQMDGGSIALAGPRGAGKSTLLRKFSGSSRIEIEEDAPCISVYLTAPAEYVPRDFIAELFQRLCQEYLNYMGFALPDPIYKERRKIRFRSAVTRAFVTVWMLARTAFLALIIIWILRSFKVTHYHTMYESTIGILKYRYHRINHWIYVNTYISLKRYWTPIRIIILILVILNLPAISLWKRHLGLRKEPELARKAREYLLRLQVDKSVTWGTTLQTPAIRGISLNANRGGTVSYTPWTFPELVGYARGFMQDISDKLQKSNHAIIVGIDEIDRIGSLEHAERFVSEIKAVFGIERCFFLVAVAEDVGSVFAQRATVGRSILENAFDDIIIIEPLNFSETRDLLIKRVPGFTDPFVYLAYALSGGLPRELIRIYRVGLST